ncbi:MULTISPECIES: phage virion morphogenesis protein [Idiomarina]|uniref:phage virion morphogenesis protein n=1 Tax=Idiomarina TaxID=135575 RepID=UPI00129BA19F|nr:MULTISPECIES: phage virion morphogenesis protein [Idiomarina]MRJ41187.1 phage virion morphogenesis protein [Idiomarina sp. FeN1]NCU56352.1 phage virion morphogenesis protein [Idiomarina sp. FenA--70]NCU59371.1 phage virion morphogenesis protein [Idiomarina sp. FenBw--71]UUN12546.1 phage virion morphogenesis protein [Idiomarina loihiensis]
MAGARIEIDATTQVIAAAIASLRSQAQDLAEPFAEIGEYLIESHQDRFKAGESPDGQAWAPLSEAYKKRAKRPSEILIEDGFLMGTLNYNPSGSELLFGTPMEYGAAHHFGYEENNLPARPWLGLSPSDSDVVVQIFRAHLSEAI